MRSWVADFFRFWWSLLYWNLSKTLFRLKVVRRCPCQSPSDSGRALETHCEACLTWERPSRFKRICPLLVETPEGLMCSADTAGVRPFWRRAAAWVAGTLAGLYAAAVISAFIVLRLLGYPVGIVNLAWPGRWHHLNEARAEYYYEKGTSSFAKGDLRAAGMSLYLSYELDPRRYDVGLMLAEIATLSMPSRADSVYETLIAQHPNQAMQTAQAWMSSALQRGDFAAVRKVALERLETGSPPQAPWLHALLFATRELGDADTLRRFASTKAGAAWQTLISTELEIREGRTTRAVASLSETWYPSNSYNAYYQTHELIALGHPSEALITLAACQSQLSGEEQASVRLAALKRMSSPGDWHTQTQTMLAQTPPTPAVVELLALHLFRYPDAAFLGEVLAWLKRRPLQPGDNSIRAYLALYCAAGAGGDRSTMDWIAGVLRSQSTNRFYFLDTLKRYFLDSNSRIRPFDFLTIVPLPLEMVYEVWTRDGAMEAARAGKLRDRGKANRSDSGSLPGANEGT